MCATKALIAGEANVLANIYRERVSVRGSGGEIWGWATAYGLPGAEKKPQQAPAGGPKS